MLTTSSLSAAAGNGELLDVAAKFGNGEVQSLHGATA